MLRRCGVRSVLIWHWRKRKFAALEMKVCVLRMSVVSINTIHLCKSFGHIFSMTVRTTIIFSLMLGLCLAVTSVVSASLMAPDSSSNAREVYAMVYGVTLNDACGDHSGHKHTCPFCHATPHPPHVSVPDMCFAFRPHELWRQGETLQRAAQARNINHSTRAPPRAV